jgi:Clp amino terminal domain, pathogenicity island component
MFESFTDRARRVVVLAQEEARMLNHSYIGTEHLLLGLIHEGDGVAAKALEALEVDLERVRIRVEEIMDKGEQVPSGMLPFTPRSKKVLELSRREALQLGHNYIGTEHILLGLIGEGEGVAAQVLTQSPFDLRLVDVREEIIKILTGYVTKETIKSQPKPFGPEDGVWVVVGEQVFTGSPYPKRTTTTPYGARFEIAYHWPPVGTYALCSQPGGGDGMYPFLAKRYEEGRWMVVGDSDTVFQDQELVERFSVTLLEPGTRLS